MCNSLKNGSRVYKIPESGFGYKLFEKSRRRITAKTFFRETILPRDAWIKWDDNIGVGDGFCFFRTKKDVKEYLKAWSASTYKIFHRIRYKQGLGKRGENGYMSSLCKEFKILKEVDIKELR